MQCMTSVSPKADAAENSSNAPPSSVRDRFTDTPPDRADKPTRDHARRCRLLRGSVGAIVNCDGNKHSIRAADGVNRGFATSMCWELRARTIPAPMSAGRPISTKDWRGHNAGKGAKSSPRARLGSALRRALQNARSAAMSREMASQAGSRVPSGIALAGILAAQFTHSTVPRRLAQRAARALGGAAFVGIPARKKNVGSQSALPVRDASRSRHCRDAPVCRSRSAISSGLVEGAASATPSDAAARCNCCQARPAASAEGRS